MADRAGKTKQRDLKPRATAALVVQPATVTDLSAPAVLGLEDRQFRDLVQRFEIKHARLGHRVICQVCDVLAALERASQTEAGPIAREPNDDGPTDAESVLRIVGRRRA